ncbi:MAG: hypothetical protein M1830_001940 [Pleopsidium flavum]|nr:MAG: hypothetical protein M1830_001940 [Pleopsidium flavum]
MATRENLDSFEGNTKPPLPKHTYNTRYAHRLNRAALPFPFERLPPELRNEIYSYLLSTPCESIHISADNQLTFSGGECRTVVRDGLHLQILYLNKAIHAEATSFFYGSKAFVFRIMESHRSVLKVKDFFSRLADLARGAVRILYIDIAREHIESIGWEALCVYLAEKMSLRQLNLVVEECRSPCNGECPSDLSCLDLPWAKALSHIKGLDRFTLHTVRCGWEQNCGFGDDGVFNEGNVENHEDSDADDGHGASDSDTSFDENILTTGYDGEDHLPCRCYLYHQCCNECFKRDFVEGLRMKMGLETGERYVRASKGEYLGCYKNVDPGRVKVPAARDVKGLSSYCRFSKTISDSEADEDEAEELEDENDEGLQIEAQGVDNDEEEDDEEDDDRGEDDNTEDHEDEEHVEAREYDVEEESEEESEGKGGDGICDAEGEGYDAEDEV